MNAPLPHQAGSDQIQRLSRALAIYNRAFRNHVGAVLRKKLGANWWEDGIVRRISSIQEDIERGDLEIETDDDALSVMEPKHYYWIVREHRELFGKLFNNRSFNIVKIGGSPTTLMHEVADWRNVYAHPPRHDLDSALVDRAIDAMQRLVSLFDSEARDEFDALSVTTTTGARETRPTRTLSDAEGEAKRIVENARDEARRLRQQAEQEAANIRTSAGTEVKATRTQDREQGRGDRADSRATDGRHRQKGADVTEKPLEQQKELKDLESKIAAARQNLKLLTTRARERAAKIEARAERKAAENLREARQEAEAIRLRPQRSRTFQSLVSKGAADAERRAERTLENARHEAKTIVDDAHREAKRIGEDSHAERENARQQAVQIIATGSQEAHEPRKKAQQDAERMRAEASRDTKRIRSSNQETQPEVRVATDRQLPTPPKKRAAERDTASADAFRRQFKRARSGNGHVRSLNVDGWWVTCWVGQARGVLCASVFSPSKNGASAQEDPLMQRDFGNEIDAFEWLSQAHASREIEREAKRAIRLYEGSDDSDE